MDKKKTIIYSLVFFNIISFSLGFYYLEEHGASLLDAELHTYPAIDGFKNSFLKNIIDYGKYGENSYPLHHLIFAFLNPFEVGSISFRLLSCFWSSLILVFFFLILSNRFSFDNSEKIFFTSLLLLSPYFRTSAFWGMTENTGLLFMALSILFYNKLKKNENVFTIFLICFFSSLALYSRIQNIFICLFFFVNLILYLPKNKKIYVILFYFLFAIPGLVLIYKWGGIIDEQYTGEFKSLINFYTIPQTLLVILSLIGFYSIPFLLSSIKDLKIFIKKYLVIYLLSLLILIILFYSFNIDILALNEKRDYSYGQGFVAHIGYKFTNIQSSYLLFSALGLCVLVKIFSFSIQNKILIISLLIIFSLRVHFFTEYLDPVLFVLALTLLDGKNIFKINYLKDIFIFQIFFSSLLLGAILV